MKDNFFVYWFIGCRRSFGTVFLSFNLHHCHANE